MRINKNWIILLAALTVGGIAAFATQSYLSTQIAQIEAREKNKTMVRLLVAKTDLEKGTALSTANVAVRAVPKEWAHSGAITPEQFSRVEGAFLAYPAYAGEPILWAQLDRERTPTFSARLLQGRRAVTIPVDEVSSVSGMVEPGDIIDVVVAVNKEGRNFTFPLLQGVTVLATGTQATPDGKADSAGRRLYTTITLETTPQDAMRLIAAREVGRVTALLRAPHDTQQIPTPRADALALLGLATNLGPATSSVPVIYGGGPITQGQRMPTRSEPGLFALQ